MVFLGKFYRAERHDFRSRFLLFILLFLFPIFLGGKIKGEENNQSRGQMSCLSARSESLIQVCIFNLIMYGPKFGFCYYLTLDLTYSVCY